MGEVEELIAQLRQFSKFMDDFKDTMKNLQLQYSLVDQEVCDIYHYIENVNLNVCSGYKVFKILQETLRKRRAVKQKIYVLQSFRDTFYNKQNISIDINKSIAAMEKVMRNQNIEGYSPKLLIDLDNMVKRSTQYRTKTSESGID